MPLCSNPTLITSKPSSSSVSSLSPPAPQSPTLDLDFSLEEIRQQLAHLGFKNLSSRQLFQIKRDLDDLIRREQIVQEDLNQDRTLTNELPVVTTSVPTTNTDPVTSSGVNSNTNLGDRPKSGLSERASQKKVKWKGMYLDCDLDDPQADNCVSIKPNRLNHSTPTPQPAETEQQSRSQTPRHERVSYATFASLLDQSVEREPSPASIHSFKPPPTDFCRPHLTTTTTTEPFFLTGCLNTCRSNQMLPSKLVRTGSGSLGGGGGSSAMFTNSSTWKGAPFDLTTINPNRMSSSRCTISHSRADSSLDMSVTDPKRNSHRSMHLRLAPDFKSNTLVGVMRQPNSNESLVDKYSGFGSGLNRKSSDREDESASFGEWPSVLEDFITHQSPGMNRDFEDTTIVLTNSISNKSKRRRRSTSIRTSKPHSDSSRPRRRQTSLPTRTTRARKTPSPRPRSRSSTPSTALNGCQTVNSIDLESEASLNLATMTSTTKSARHSKSGRFSKHPGLKVRVSRPQSANSACPCHYRKMGSSLSTYGHNYVYKRRQDPVSKYQAYQRDWQMFNVPGENSRRLLRWNVRTAMMHREVPLLQRNCAQLAQIIGPSAYQIMNRERRRRIRSLQLDYIPPTSRRYNDLRSSIKSSLTARI